MKKFNYIVLLALLCAFGSISAQNTASASGNWNVCATWGNPSGITKGNDVASAKTINNGIAVTMNTNWNAQNVSFTGNGALDFANTANALDLNVAGGAAQACVTFQLNCGSATQTGSMASGTNYPAGPSSSAVNKTVPYSNSTGGTYPAQSITSTGVTGLTATAAAGNLTVGSGSIVFRITGTPSSGGTANFLINIGGQSCTFTVSVSATVPAANFIVNGANTNGCCRYNASHTGGDTSDVTINNNGFVFNVASTYTITGTINITSLYGPNNSDAGVYLSGQGQLAGSIGLTSFTRTVTVSAGSSMYFWSLVSIGNTGLAETHISYTVSGTVKRN